MTPTFNFTRIDCVIEESIDGLENFFTVSCVAIVFFTPPIIILNLLVLFGIYKTPSLHSPSNALLCGLALTDLGAGVVAMPLLAVKYIAFAHKDQELWCGSIVMVSKLIQPPFSGISIATLTLISIDRLLALTLHMRYAMVITVSRFVRVFIVISIGAFAFSFSYLANKKVTHWSVVSIYGICLIICSVNNACIFRIIHRHQIDIKRQLDQMQVNQSCNIATVKSRKTSKNMLWLYVAFMFCYTPFIIMRIIRNYWGTNTAISYGLHEASYSLLFINSLVNPILYCVKITEIRKAIFRVTPKPLKLCFSFDNCSPTEE